MQIFSLILQVILALPKLIDLIRVIQREAESQKTDRKIEDDEKAVDNAIKTGDQREVENRLGSPTAGKPAVDRDGVQERRAKNPR